MPTTGLDSQIRGASTYTYAVKRCHLGQTEVLTPINEVNMETETDLQAFKSELQYNPETGEIYSLRKRGNVKAGKKLGSSKGDGYKTLDLHKKTYFFHRVAFAMHYGFFPEMVDHINNDREDNRAINLRASNKLLNARNALPKNGNRFRGACRRNNIWEVLIRHEGKHISIGRFKSEVEAAYAYDMASLQYHGEYGKRNFLPFVV